MNYLCLDCKTKEHNVIVTGSLLCKECQNKMFARLREKYGIREGKVSIKVEKTRSERMEEAKELLRTTDLSVPEIAKKLGLKEPAVYYHASKIRKKKQEQTAADEEIKDKPIQDKDNNDNFKEKYEKLEKEFKQIESKYTSLMMDFNEYKKVYKNNSEAIQQLKNKNNSLEEKYEELLGKYRTLESDFWKVQKERNELQQKIKGFKENDTYTSLLSKYNIEKAKHETLLKYLMLQVEENQKMKKLKESVDYLEQELRNIGFSDTDLDNDFLWKYQENQGEK